MGEKVITYEVSPLNSDEKYTVKADSVDVDQNGFTVFKREGKIVARVANINFREVEDASA